MERVYNAHIDNGLFVLSYYLDKDVEDINLQDIKDSTQIFADKYTLFNKTPYYQKGITMGFQNSCYTQGVKVDNNVKELSIKIKNDFDKILDSMGNDEFCMICGEKNIDISADNPFTMSRSVFPRLAGGTFYNFSNNLQLINVCPVCAYLSMIGLYNFTKTSDTHTIYISESNDFMEDYTYKKQVEFNQNVALNLGVEKKQKSRYAYITEIVEDIIDNKKIYDKGIEAVSFNNSAQTEIYIESFLSNKDIIFIKDLQELSLLSEFKERWLMGKFIDRKIQKNYLYYSLKAKISKDLFNKIEEVYCKLGETKLKLIKRICREVYEHNNKNEVKQLKEVLKLNQFEGILLDWQSQYKEKTGNNLFNPDEYSMLCNHMQYNSVKNRMLAEFSFLS